LQKTWQLSRGFFSPLCALYGEKPLQSSIKEIEMRKSVKRGASLGEICRHLRGEAGAMAREENGQSLVLVSFCMIAFLGILGLVLDIGYAYARQRQMQTAADAAALAGTRELAYGNGEVVALSRIEQILTSNGADISVSDYTIKDNRAVVTARTNIAPFFTPIFGLNQIPVGANADAVFGQTAEMSSVLPFAVEEDLWALDQEVNIWTGETGPGGNYGWVRWGGQSLSTSVLRANIDDPSNSGVLHVGDVVAGKTGVSFSAVRGSLEAKIGQTIDVFFYDGEEVTGAGANLRYTITGFGKFRLTGIRSRGAQSEILGYFIQAVNLGGEIIPGTTIGTMSTGLVR
jgi:Flp pilus assembly protein TadG